MKYFGLWATVTMVLFMGAFWVSFLMEALANDSALPEHHIIGFVIVTLGLSGSITSSIALAKDLK